MLDNFKFDNITAAIAAISALIKKFTDMLKNFVDSWKKVPAASKEDFDDTVVDPYSDADA
jgi:hypothetical protein